MRSRHLLLRLLLVAGLVLGQPAGFAHGLSHVDFAAIQAAAGISSVGLHRDEQPGAVELCEECFAFAQLAVAAPAPFVATVAHVAAVANAGGSAIPRIALDPVFASLPRGPPAA